MNFVSFFFNFDPRKIKLQSLILLCIKKKQCRMNSYRIKKNNKSCLSKLKEKLRYHVITCTFPVRTFKSNK